MRVARKLTFVGVLFAALGLLSTNSAYAAPGLGSGVVQGAGSIGPGLIATPRPQSVSFSGSVTGAFASTGGADVGTINCSFSGGSNTTVGDNYAVGAGTVSGNCAGTGTVTGASISVSCSAMTYARVSTIVIVASANCRVTVNGQVSNGAAVGALNFLPATNPPGNITNYSLAGTATFAGV